MLALIAQVLMPVHTSTQSCHRPRKAAPILGKQLRVETRLTVTRPVDHQLTVSVIRVFRP